MSFDNLDNDNVRSDVDEEEGGAPEEASNRTFLIVAGVFGAIVVLSLICLVLFVVFKVLPGRNTQATKATQAVRNNVNTLEAAMKTGTAIKWTPTYTKTPSPTPVTPTAAVTDTPVIKPSSTPTSVNNGTVIALQKTATEAKAAQGRTSPTVTPNSTYAPSGFADQVGAPALLGLAAVLLVVIFLARRLRTSHT